MVRSVARTAYPVVAGLFVACAVIQVFLAGLGVFDDPSSFITHRNFGYMIGWLTLVLLVVALVGRMPRRFIGLAVLLLVLFSLQSVFVALREDMPGDRGASPPQRLLHPGRRRDRDLDLVEGPGHGPDAPARRDIERGRVPGRCLSR